MLTFYSKVNTELECVTIYFHCATFSVFLYLKSLFSPLIHLLPSCLYPLQHFNSVEVLYTVRTDLDDFEAGL